MAACGVHVPSRLVAVNERKKRPFAVLRLDDHEVLVLTLDLVDLNRLEQVGRRVAHDLRVRRPKLPGKLPMGMLAR